jgi:AAA15 family ATPase/GTPase
MLKSHIRDSQKRELAEKIRKKNFRKYLLAVQIENLRVFGNASIQFDYPITAIVGPNGSGKSTVLMSSGCAYKSVKPSDFFAKSALDEGLKNAKVRFTLIDKDSNRTEDIRTSISHRGSKWDRKKVFDRSIRYFGIRRTVPPAEKSELSQLRSRKIKPSSQIQLNENEIRHIRRILGFDSNYEYYSFSQSKDLFLANRNNNTYSEFHFGAGESSIARLVYDLERLDDYSLVLIEEIENGLHPLAVVRLVEYLFDVCIRKKHQVIFTTHSNYALLDLPDEAVWHCINGQIEQGKVNIEILRVLQGDIEKQLVVFTEDIFAKTFIETTLRQFGKLDLLDLVEIHEVGGKNQIIHFVDSQNENPAIKTTALGVLDGDVSDEEFSKSKHKDKFQKLPGLMPEKEVWDAIMQDIDNFIAKLTLKLNFSVSQQNFVKTKILDTNREVLDSHLLFAVLGEKLGFIAEITVINAFISTYVEYNNGKLKYIVDFLDTYI